MPEFIKIRNLSTFVSTMNFELISTGAYAMFFGWPYAVGLVGLIGVHESGHIAAMRYYGIECE